MVVFWVVLCYYSCYFSYRLTGDESGTPYDKESMAIIHLNNTTVMYLKEVTKFLALVCFLREESFERRGLIDYNFHCFKKAIEDVFDVRLKVQRSRKLLSQRRWSRQTVPNGTQVHPHWRALNAPWSVTVTLEWRLHTDFACASNLLQGHLLLFSNSKWWYRFSCAWNILHG